MSGLSTLELFIIPVKNNTWRNVEGIYINFCNNFNFKFFLNRWKGILGNEMISCHNRMMITPVTEKYFLYIGATLREKSGVAFQSIKS
jgi:hypothetical protein